MFALIYLGLAIALGDLLCRRFFRFVSVLHRWAAATLVGVLVSTWFTYLAALAFAYTAEPLLWADLVFFVAMTPAIFWLWTKPSKFQIIEPQAPGRTAYDWITLGALFVVACVLLTGTLYINTQGHIRVSGIEATHFAIQSAIAQSFALGQNFPPECPYYAGGGLHYDFLFYFQAGNLERLGLNLAWAVDILSVLSLTSMLALLMVLGELLFNSRVVGRIGATLFFFHGSIASIPFLRFQRDETWTSVLFINQRHLPSALGVLLLVLIFLIDQYRESSQKTQSRGNEISNVHAGHHAQIKSIPLRTATNVLEHRPSFVFAGILLGALPLWNASVFIAAIATLLLLLILFPYRLQVVLLGITVAVVALPQLFLGSGQLGARPQPLFYSGSVDNPSVVKFINHVGLTFGAKWPVIILALTLVSWVERRLFLALCSVFILAFTMRFGTGMSANHIFLSIWVTVANLFAAYGLWWLWKSRAIPIFGRLTATTLAGIMLAGGIVDLVQIRGNSYVEVNYERDDLVRWLRRNTNQKDVFLTNRVLSHPVLLAGRRIFLGSHDSPAGNDLGKREPIYRQMFESNNPRRVFELLKQNRIGYVAFDDAVRHSESPGNANEYIYARYFRRVYEDKENRYGKLVMYKVPESIPVSLANMDLSEPPVTAFQGGKGIWKGQFDNPRGLAIDSGGNIFVADTDNSRIEKFSPNGTYITSIGLKGIGDQQLGKPNGIAIDNIGNIYVADVASHSVRKLAPNRTFIAEWKGPLPGFYGPRKISIGPDNSIYVVDQGRNRIVKFHPAGEVLAVWGSGGRDDGQFSDPTSVAVDPKTNRVFVADPINRRIQVFDSNGKFLTKWLIPEWGRPQGFEDLAIDSQASRLYASSGNMNTILVFDLRGNRLARLSPKSPDKLQGPSAIVLAKNKLLVLNSGSARVSVIDLQNE